MAKKKQQKQEWKPTRKYVSNLQKQQRKLNIIKITSAIVILAVVVMVVLGLVFQWYIPKVKPLGDVVIEVNGTTIKMSEYIDAVKYQTQGYSEQLIPYFLDPVANNIITGELIKQYAEDLGYTVTPKEIGDYLKEKDIEATDVLRSYTHVYLVQMKLIDEYFKPQVPAETELRAARAMFLESQAQADEILQRLANGEDFADIASELSLDELTKKESGELGKHPAGIISATFGSSNLDELVFSAGLGIHSSYEEDKSKSIGYWLAQVQEWGEDEDNPIANIKIMLLSSEEEAQMIREKLLAGEDFDELAEEYSSVWNETTGAFFEEVVPDDVSAAFDKVVFDGRLPAGEISVPIADDEQTTKGGYWVYEISAIETGPISEEDTSTLSYLELEAWTETISKDENNVIENHLDDAKKQFAIDRITG